MGRNDGEECDPTSATSRPLWRNAIARARPTGPAPRMTTSTTIRRVAHQGFDVGDGLGRLRGEHFAAVVGDPDVVLDANADVAQPLGHVFRRADVEAGLDRERHAGLERAPAARTLVFAGI